MRGSGKEEEWKKKRIKEEEEEDGKRKQNESTVTGRRNTRKVASHQLLPIAVDLVALCRVEVTPILNSS